MRRTCLFIILLTSTFYAFSQDIIIRTNGNKINCEIAKVDSVNVYFNLYRNGNLVSSYLNKRQIKEIEYGSSLSKNSTLDSASIGQKNKKKLLTSAEQQLKYDRKVVNYRSLQITGGCFAGGGFGMSIIGIVDLIEGSKEMKDDWAPIAELGSEKHKRGKKLTICGSSMLVFGAFLNSVGTDKMKELNKKYKLGLLYNNEMKGITLTYRF
jgi:hypothetical protein